MITESFSDSTGSYIRIVGDERDRISDTVIGSGCISGICPLSIEKVNGNREYIYEVTGFISLSEYIEENGITKRLWIKVLNGICELISGLEEHMLDGEHLVVDIENIYVRGEEPEVAGVFISEHKRMLGESVMELMEKALKFPDMDRETSEFIYRLHGLCAKKRISRKDLLAFLGEEDPYLSEKASGDESPDKIEDKGRLSSRITAGKAGGQIDDPLIKEVMRKLRHRDVPERSERMIGKSKNGDISAENKDTIVNIRSKLLSLGLLGSGIVIPIILIACGFFTSRTTGKIDLTSVVALFLFFIAAAGYGAWKLWPGDDVYYIVDEEETVSVCMVPRDSGMRIIPVEGFPWSIGSDDRKCDAVLASDAVSPLHAVLKRQGKAVFITDQESSAGTFHNGDRLTPWSSVRLKDGDLVAFGDVRYVVEIDLD